jgi:cytochrome c553
MRPFRHRAFWQRHSEPGRAHAAVLRWTDYGRHPEICGPFMKVFVCVLVLAFLPVSRIGAESPQQEKSPDLSWAFLAPDKVQPEIDDEGRIRHVPGSTKTYTQTEIDDLSNPPDWFPGEYGVMPQVVQHGGGPSVLACASCHLTSGFGHPESANLAGLSAAYIGRQLADFKSGARIGEAMPAIAKGLSDEDARQASTWFANLKPKVWQTVVETDSVPKTYVNEHLMRLPLPGGGVELLGNRIIELPQDPARAESRDPHSGFVAYVPVGSIAKGKELVTTGGSGKTIACSICHGPSLTGLGEVPAIAAHSPIYIFRQLYGFQTGARIGGMAPLMKGVVAQLDQDDMVAIAAYVSSRTP